MEGRTIQIVSMWLTKARPHHQLTHIPDIEQIAAENPCDSVGEYLGILHERMDSWHEWCTISAFFKTCKEATTPFGRRPSVKNPPYQRQ